jgi:hypothetical protein
MAIRAIVLEAGECATLPNNSSILSVLIEGDAAVASSTCANLPTPGAYECWAFSWEEDDGGSMQDAIFEQLIIGSNTYNVPSTFGTWNTQDLSVWIQEDPNLTGVVKLGCNTHTGGGTYILKINVAPGLGTPMLKISNPDADGAVIMYLHAVTDPDCSDCS